MSSSDLAAVWTHEGGWQDFQATGCLVLADGRVFEALGHGAEGVVGGEVCFNTAMTGYQEILTDPSYFGQIVAFTTPHIGNVGTNSEDYEHIKPDPHRGAMGAIVRQPLTRPSSWRSAASLNSWLRSRGLIVISMVDTRALTRSISQHGLTNAVIAHSASGEFHLDELRKRATSLPSLQGAELASQVSSEVSSTWSQADWDWPGGFGESENSEVHPNRPHVVVVDFGVKRAILRRLAASGCHVSVVPARAGADDILRRKPDGVVLANGPGDPAATAVYAEKTVRELLGAGVPLLGICLGHQLLAQALGARTRKMEQGHHGGNHPVLEKESGRVGITVMNHVFTVDQNSLPESVVETHVSLFDGSNCGIMTLNGNARSVQFHPEASPGPTDARIIIDRFADQARTYQDRDQSRTSQ